MEARTLSARTKQEELDFAASIFREYRYPYVQTRFQNANPTTDSQPLKLGMTLSCLIARDRSLG